MEELFNALDKIGCETKAALHRFCEDVEMYSGYVLDYPEEPTMAKLVKAMDEGDYETAQAASHALKGVTRNLGFLRLADALTDMNEEFKAGNREDAIDAYPDVQKQYKIHCEVINEWKEKHAAQPQ